MKTADHFSAGGVRLGLVVGKRQARRAVDRVLVKRVVREAARKAYSGVKGLLAAAARGDASTAPFDRYHGVDIVVRLKQPLPPRPPSDGATALWRRDLKTVLRHEADALFDRLIVDLAARPDRRRAPRASIDPVVSARPAGPGGAG